MSNPLTPSSYLTTTSRIEVFGADGSYWCVSGPGMGEQGVYLGQDQVKGLMDAPLRQAWKSGARQQGGTLNGEWVDVRDISLGFQVVDDVQVDVVISKFRKAFTSRKDIWDPDAKLARIAYTTEMSGTRSIDVQLYEAADFDPGMDVLLLGRGNPIFPLRSGQPMWYWDDVISAWSTTSTSGSGFVGGTTTGAEGPLPSNPTDQPMPMRWVLTRGQWTLPDFSWRGPAYARVPGVDVQSGLDHTTRTILCPLITSTDVGAVVTTDTSTEIMIRSANGTNLLGRMPVPGKYFTHWMPPYTPPTALPVSVTSAPSGGAMVQLVQQRYSQWPWGLE